MNKGILIVLREFLLYSVNVSMAICIPNLNAYSKMAASARLIYSLQQSWNFSNVSFCSSVKLFFQVLMMPCHVAEEFLHLWGVGSTILLRNYVSVPQFVYYNFHRSHLLLAQQHTTEGCGSPALFRK